MQRSFIGVPQERHRANNWEFPVAGETREGTWGAGAETAEFVIFLVKFAPCRNEVLFRDRLFLRSSSSLTAPAWINTDNRKS